MNEVCRLEYRRSDTKEEMEVVILAGEFIERRGEWRFGVVFGLKGADDKKIKYRYHPIQICALWSAIDWVQVVLSKEKGYTSYFGRDSIRYLIPPQLPSDYSKQFYDDVSARMLKEERLTKRKRLISEWRLKKKP